VAGPRASAADRATRGFYRVIVVATVLGMVFNFAGIDPIKALFWTAVLNGFSCIRPARQPALHLFSVSHTGMRNTE